jgi:hypothetical protein
MREKWHYVYYSYEEWGRGYIGKRSSFCHPDEDPYLGSFGDKSFKPTQKIVLAIFESSEEALEAEILLHNFYQVHKNSHFANRAKQTSAKFECDPEWYSRMGEREKLIRASKIGRSLSSGARGFYFCLRSPDGKIIVTQNLRETCRNHGLQRSALQKVLRGERTHSAGWTITKHLIS